MTHTSFKSEPTSIVATSRIAYKSVKTSAMAPCRACFPLTPPPLQGRSTITGWRSSSTWSYRDRSHTLVAVVCTPADITIENLVRCEGARSNLKLTLAFREGLRADLVFPEGSGFAGIQELLPVEAAEKLDQFCDHPVPSDLMTGPEAGAVITVKVLVEQKVFLPLRLALQSNL
jgi:hypothetical protein